MSFNSAIEMIWHALAKDNYGRMVRSFTETIGRDRIFKTTLAVLAVLTLCRVLLALSTNLSEDEAYYWIWSRSLALSYYDHPPMIAYWIKIGTTLWGNTAWGVRFIGLLSITIASYLVYRISLILFKDRVAAALCVFWLNATIIANAASLIATPDTPLVFFTALFLFSLAKLIDTENGNYWYAIGFSLGAAFLSKYTATLLLPGLFLWMMTSQEGRQWFGRIQPYLAAILALIVISPVFIWNANHGWTSFLKQANHSVKDHPLNAWVSLGEFVAGQTGLVTPIIFLVCVWGSFYAFMMGITKKDTRLLALGSLSAPLLAFFFVHSLSQKIQPNWPGFIYIAAIMAGVHSAVIIFKNRPQPIWLRWSFRFAPYVGLLCVAVVFMQLAFSILPIQAKKDPTSHLKGWHQFADAVAAVRTTNQADLILMNKYASTGELAFYLDSTDGVLQINQRIRYINLPEPDRTRFNKPALFVSKTGPLTPSIASAFNDARLLTTIDRKVGVASVEAYDIYLLTGYRGGLLDERK